MSAPLSLAVLISGGGTTLKNLLRKIDQQELAAQVNLVVSSNPSAAGLQFAADAGIATEVAQRKNFSSDETFGEKVFSHCREAAGDLVVMGGFLKRAPLPGDFENRVINIHPSLIPSFCGHGFYGKHVHQAVLDYGAKLSGCTVHFVDNEYDNGPIIMQRAVPVHSDDTPELLAARVFKEECDALPQAIGLFGAGRLQVVGRVVKVLDDPAP